MMISGASSLFAPGFFQRRLLAPIPFNELDTPPITQRASERGPGDAADQHGDAKIVEEDLGQQLGVLQQAAVDLVETGSPL